MEWQPIDTAPEDGSKVLGFCVANGHSYISVIWWRGNKYKIWSDRGFQWRNTLDDSSTRGFADTLDNDGPTHWMPLPDAPK